jgi:hypothetical protein
MKSSIFWDITPCSPLKVKQHFGGIFRLHLYGRRISKSRNQREAACNQSCLLATCFTLISCLAHSSALKMEATYSSETPVDLQRTIWHYIPEDRTLQNKSGSDILVLLLADKQTGNA